MIINHLMTNLADPLLMVLKLPQMVKFRRRYHENLKPKHKMIHLPYFPGHVPEKTASKWG